MPGACASEKSCHSAVEFLTRIIYA
jgi:chromosome segregation ATPase